MDDNQTFTHSESEAYRASLGPCPTCGSQLDATFQKVKVAEDDVDMFVLASRSCTNPACLGG